MTFLLDTDTIIYMIRGLKRRDKLNAVQIERAKQAHRILQRARQKKDRGDVVGVSAIAVAELEFGARCSISCETEANAVRRTLAPFTLFSFDAVVCAQRYGEIRRILEVAGKSIGSQDMFIAAHALALDAILVTNNTSEFSRVPALHCENWSR